MEIRKISVQVLMALMTTSPCISQVTIGPGDMPQDDDTFSFAFSGMPLGSDASMTGEDVFWDYTGLSPDINDVDTFIAVSETPFLFQFFFNNPFLYPAHNADYARDEIDVNLGLINISDAYSYFKNDAEGLRNVGFGANINGIPASVRNIPVDWIYEFPLSYGNSHSSYSESELEIPGLGYYFRSQQREVEVEGWGTLSLPGGEYEVLKVKMIINSQDSVYIESLEQGLAIPSPEETRYQWLTPGEIEPILEVSQQFGFGALVRFKSEFPSSVEELSTIDLKIYPNPVSELLTINSGLSKIQSYAIFDSNGKLITRKDLFDASEHQLMVRNFARGEYFILLEVDGSSYYSSFFKN